MFFWRLIIVHLFNYFRVLLMYWSMVSGDKKKYFLPFLFVLILRRKIKEVLKKVVFYVKNIDVLFYLNSSLICNAYLLYLLKYSFFEKLLLEESSSFSAVKNKTKTFGNIRNPFRKYGIIFRLAHHRLEVVILLKIGFPFKYHLRHFTSSQI